ncbi:MAG: acetyl-CoA C-acyltransferase [Bacteroidetes bacterium]|nr:acetyl-CoA C-acyltransferase [Bacteroidota bacterium]
MKKVYVVSAVRTPMGSFGGVLSTVSATDLGAVAIRSALERSGISGDKVDEVFMGNVLSAGLGQAPARQAALKAGLPNTVPCTTVNKVCASGMKSIMLAAQSIQLGHAQIAVAGGMENMSQVPYYVSTNRFGQKLGHGQLTDGMIKDGLWDVYNDYHMGNAGELCAREMQFTRQDQDAYAIESYRRAQAAWSAGKFNAEIAPVTIAGRKGDVIVSEDEEYKSVQFEKIPELRPVFDKNGSITAANASTLNDGASALVLVSEEALQTLNLTPLAEIKGFADAATEPCWFTIAPALAVPKALQHAGIKSEQVDLYELNEAFAVVALANNKKLNLNPDQVNVYGGAVSLGHPLGSSGARIVVTLLHALNQEDKKFGVASLCNGGGGASAIVVERC